MSQFMEEKSAGNTQSGDDDHIHIKHRPSKKHREGYYQGDQ